MRFTDLVSACPVASLAAPCRFDPYWDGIWAAGSQASWVSYDTAMRQESAGLGSLPTHLRAEKSEAWRMLFAPGKLWEGLSVLGVLDSWRTATAQQIAAFTGVESVASGRSTVARELFTSELVDVGIFTNALQHTRSTPAGTIYRPSRTTVFERFITPELTWPEWVSVTGGLPFESGGQFDRHNLLATELALRVSEWCEIGAVVGEKLSSYDLLAHSGAGFEQASGNNRSADGTFVRTDGMRVALELTASTGRTFEAKVRRWASLLANRRLADTGLVVLFVVAENPGKKVRGDETMDTAMKAIARAAREFPGVNFDRVADRMFITHWRDWFPAPGEVSPSFLSLDARRPSGPSGALWQPASVLDVLDVPFEPSHPEVAEAVLSNAGVLSSVPFWLRDRSSTPKLWERSMRECGFETFPVPPSREGRVREFGRASGVAGDTEVPLRLASSPEARAPRF